MKMKPCDYCNGSGHDPAEHNSYFPITCYICEGTGTIPDEPVSHCQACGEPVEVGREWCPYHQPAADLWEALNRE
jgi:DnaJ-class molecular chaperone